LLIASKLVNRGAPGRARQQGAKAPADEENAVGAAFFRAAASRLEDIVFVGSEGLKLFGRLFLRSENRPQNCSQER
jgi:hypothetical protein